MHRMLNSADGTRSLTIPTERQSKRNEVNKTIIKKSV